MKLCSLCFDVVVDAYFGSDDWIIQQPNGFYTTTSLWLTPWPKLIRSSGPRSHRNDRCFNQQLSCRATTILRNVYFEIRYEVHSAFH